MTKHRAHVIQALASVIEQVVLDRCAHHTRRGFWAQGQGVAVEAIFKGVHLFFDDVGHLAQSTHKQGRGLNDGGADVAIAMTTHQLTHELLQPLPAVRVDRQQVIHAFDGG